jgi:hypothetical protein
MPFKVYTTFLGELSSNLFLFSGGSASRLRPVDFRLSLPVARQGGLLRPSFDTLRVRPFSVPLLHRIVSVYSFYTYVRKSLWIVAW